MKWRTAAIEDLKDYKYRLVSLPNMQQKIQALEEEMVGIRSTTSDMTPVKGGGNQREERLLNCIAEKERLECNIRVTKMKIRPIERSLEALTEEENRILELFYIHRPPDYIDILKEELHIEKTEVYKRKDEALRKFTICQYGIPDY